MSTARTLIRRALMLLNVLATGEPMPADMAADGLSSLNDLLGSWSLERFLVYHIGRVNVPLVPGQGTYTWGAGGDIPAPRPLRLEGAVLTMAGTPDIEWPVDLLSQRDYELGVWMKGISSAYPTAVYLESSYPLARLHVWFVPTEAFNLGLLPWVRLTSFPTLDTEVLLPEGFERALRFGLAVDLAPEYGKPVAPEIAGVLADAKRSLKAHYTVVPTLGMPAGLTSAGGEDMTEIYTDVR